MSRVSKKKFWEALKREPDPEHSIFDMFRNPPSQEEWLKGYKRWQEQTKKYIEEHTLSTPLSEYEAIEKATKRRKKKC